MGNSAASNGYGKSQTKVAVGDLSKAYAAERQTKQSRATPINASEIEGSAAAAAVGVQQQRQQTSTWSLGSLSGRWNWSFTGASRNSFRNRNKSTRKSLTSLQQHRSKTTWHKPITNTIFSSHFKDSSRNDQFHIEHLVAKGAFGVVYKVTDSQSSSTLLFDNIRKQFIPEQESTSPVYALKVLRKSKIIEEHSVQQIKDEADIQKLCGHHPFIVQQIDLWQNRHNLHILSEYVPNGELFSKIAQFSIDLIRLYLGEIALAIDFLHNAGIIYRDAKPENILLTKDYHIKLTDFGLSKWLKQGATTKTMCGTFQYMAPEILRGEVYGHAVDWWSLGIIVCQMLLQKSPDIREFLSVALPGEPQQNQRQDYVDNASQKVLNEVMRLDDYRECSPSSTQFLPAEVETLPHAAQDVLKRLLEVNPKFRIRSVMALQRIALYKDFKIDSKHLLSISPLDIIAKDKIILYEDNKPATSSSALDLLAFHGF